MRNFDEKFEALRSRFLARLAGDRRALLDEALSLEDLEAVVHRLSGSAGMYGYAALSTSAETLENAIRDGATRDTIGDLVEDLIAEIRVVQAR
ncbi:Hpt domain-containing protein [Sphingomonas edaphi]|uniref:Hpt domain-containing protein n=1 Tax=Sphingomonas edaphi TaxID=2315689 RepID=A0A418PYC9_9SPHN|nr:Hpt domain-containing protein [Sphingomonas edaphi]RIX26999.1 Hpt domain-containing protein [Sphingomonas edaphi]